MPCRIVKGSHASSPVHAPDVLGRWERLCARVCSARQIDTAVSLNGTNQKVTLNVLVLRNVRVSSNPSWANLSLLCTSIFLTSVSLVSLPHQAPINHYLPNSAENPHIFAELTEEQKWSQESLWSSRQGCGKPACHQLRLPHKQTLDRLALGCIYLTKHAGKCIKGEQLATNACSEPKCE